MNRSDSKLPIVEVS